MPAAFPLATTSTADNEDDCERMKADLLGVFLEEVFLAAMW